MAAYPAPAIFNIDQGSQFTADAFTAVLQAANVQISMDGKGWAIDNIFVERLWRTRGRPVKAYTDGWDLDIGLAGYFEFYNCRRFHQSLAYQTLEQVFKGEEKSIGQVGTTNN